MLTIFSTAPFRVLLSAVFACLLLSRPVAGGEMSADSLPRTVAGLKGLLGDGYLYIDKGDLLVVSDLDPAKVLPLVSGDFLMNMQILRRDFFTRSAQPAGGKSLPMLTVFLFKNRESYIAGLRKIGINVAEEDETNRGAVRDGYYYGGKGRNFILINYRDNYAQGLATYTHEMSHALMRREFPDAPAWINEGIATMVGHCRLMDGRLQYYYNGSVGSTKSALEAGNLPTVSELLTITNREYADAEGHGRYYDAGEQFCRFLHSRNQLLPVYRALRDNGDGRESPEQILRRVTGLGLNGLEKAWHTWLSRER